MHVYLFNAASVEKTLLSRRAELFAFAYQEMWVMLALSAPLTPKQIGEIAGLMAVGLL